MFVMALLLSMSSVIRGGDGVEIKGGIDASEIMDVPGRICRHKIFDYQM